MEVRLLNPPEICRTHHGSHTGKCMERWCNNNTSPQVTCPSGHGKIRCLSGMLGSGSWLTTEENSPPITNMLNGETTSKQQDLMDNIFLK